MTRGREEFESSGNAETVESNPWPISEIDEPNAFDNSVPAKLLLETPNIRLFEIGFDKDYGYANYGWTESSEGSWGAGGDASNSQAGGKSLWVTLSASQSASLRTANGWLIVSIDGHETPVCFAHEIEYLHVRSSGTIDLTGIDKETLSTNLVIDVNGGTGFGTLIGRADADCLFVGDGNAPFFLGEENEAVTSACVALAEFMDAPTATFTDSLNADGVANCLVTTILDSLFCDVAFIDSAKLGEGADVDVVEEEELVTADDTIAEDETLTELYRGGPTRPRVRPGMELNL